MDDLRRIEIKNNNGTWNKIEFSEMKKGDIFRMFEPTGEQVIDLNHGNTRTEFLAISDVYIDKQTNQPMIDIDGGITEGHIEGGIK